MSSERTNRTAPGQPGLWCQWVPCWDGCCLAFNGYEKFYAAIPWLRYLIQHFLEPNALASTTGHPMFANFGFDHRLDGMVVGCRRDNKELYAIRVLCNEVVEEVLRPADQRYVDRPPLPYEVQIDLEVADRNRRRRIAGSCSLSCRAHPYPQPLEEVFELSAIDARIVV